jgi:hypothetical protein
MHGYMPHTQPRGYVAAASFWNYNASLDASSPEFEARIWKLNGLLRKRGSLVCPSGCRCDQLTACGKSYLSQPPEPEPEPQPEPGPKKPEPEPRR